MGFKPKKNNNISKNSYFELFGWATTWEWFLLIIAAVAAFIKALVHPFAIIVYSELMAMFVDRNLGIGTSSNTILLPLFGGGKVITNGTHQENMDALKEDAMSFGILVTIDSVVMLISGIIYVDLFNLVALNIIVRMRKKYFKATIRQDIGWHDMAQDQNFATYITDNMEKIRNGISENVGHFIQLLCDIIISVLISFIYGWKLTSSICVYIPITMILNYTVSKYQSKYIVREQNSFGKAASVAEEVMGAIRTVVAFGGEKEETERFEKRLEPARKYGQLKGAFTGLSDSVLKAMLFLCSGAAFYYGSVLVLADRDKPPDQKEYTAAVLNIVIVGILVGADHIARTSPFLESFASARGSAQPIYEVLERNSKIDPLSKDGKIWNYNLKGDIEFQDVFFQYPAREDTIVLRGLNLSIKSGQTVALVGHSGCGKSTVLQMVQRFYDPVFGKVLLDNENIRNYNVNWLRSNIAVVGQEPVLFFGTIAENIRYGKTDATQKELEDSARAAGAHDFISALPDGYDTFLSEKGVQLSGGQRQRIAIARALVQNPKILLLDEATSALDYNSEKLVQEALDRARVGRTTVVVSHRLSAICNADRIIYIENGRAVEEGTHDELVLKGGQYAAMVNAHQYEGIEDEVLTAGADDFNKNEKERKFSRASDIIDAANFDIKQRFSVSSLEKNMVQMLNRSGKIKLSDTETNEVNYTQIFLRIVKTARPEWKLLIIGVICAAIYGCSQPAFSIVYAELAGSLQEPDADLVLLHSRNMALISVALGIIAGVACYTQTYFFNLVGVWLTTRMRSLTFKAILRQDVGWFDSKENSVGALSARLSGDTSSLQGAIGFPLSNIIQAMTNFTCSIIIAFSFSWELALICLCTSPFMVASIIFEARYITKSAIREKEVLEETSRIATESIAQIRTVAALRREAGLIEEYNREVDRYRVQIRERIRFRGVINSLGMSIMFFGYAVTLTYGGIMVADGKIKFESVMKIANTMLYGLFLLAQSLAFTPAFNAAIISASRLYQILDRNSVIQSPDLSLKNGLLKSSMKSSNVQGVSFQDLHFRYPTRRNHKVLHGFNLDVLQGKTVALVGASGSGKSTCVQLLLRFYDPDSGKIMLDGNDVKSDLSLESLRSQLGLVSQEPSLFEKTIAENIAYGDNSRTVPIEEIISAAKMANAHNFITALPQGYDTCLGAKGTQLSGGQKQRIAIARALVRNPKVLLLDEATSALDLLSEKIVQQALDEACSGRTCIVIAHRLSTVQNADLICVMRNGRIVEKGSHPQLLALNGIYAKLYRSQPKTQ